MKLPSGEHLAYCTNVHRGETWPETFAALEKHTLPVRQRVAPGKPYAIGLRLGHRAAEELAQPAELTAFRKWLDRHDCYVFTLNGFPYGSFHGTRVKEQVYAPDWSTPERLAYTKRLFDLIAEIAPAESGGSVSTSPGSFKGWFSVPVGCEPVAGGPPTYRLTGAQANGDASRLAAILSNFSAIGRYIDDLAQRTGRDLHLGIEPEPRCLIETSEEMVAFFDRWHDADAGVTALMSRVGMNYDCCHLAIEFEEPVAALDRIASAGIRLSKLHLSSALRVKPDAAGREALKAYVEPTYLHQVVVGSGTEVRRRFTDLPEALADPQASQPDDEWRVHFHIPLHAAPGAPFLDTRDHIIGALGWLKTHPGACTHLEMETYTWEVLPPNLRQSIEDQLVSEYRWTLEAVNR